MNHFSKRLDAIEPAVIATMTLTPEVEAMVHRVAVAYDIDPAELRLDAIQLAWESRDMTLDQLTERVAAARGIPVGELSAEIDRVLTDAGNRPKEGGRS